MNKIAKTALTLAACAAGLFFASIVVYLFNLDMKLIALIQPKLGWIYDRVERRPMP